MQPTAYGTCTLSSSATFPSHYLDQSSTIPGMGLMQAERPISHLEWQDSGAHNIAARPADSGKGTGVTPPWLVVIPPAEPSRVLSGARQDRPDHSYGSECGRLFIVRSGKVQMRMG